MAISEERKKLNAGAFETDPGAPDGNLSMEEAERFIADAKQRFALVPEDVKDKLKGKTKEQSPEEVAKYFKEQTGLTVAPEVANYLEKNRVEMINGTDHKAKERVFAELEKKMDLTPRTEVIDSDGRVKLTRNDKQTDAMMDVINKNTPGNTINVDGVAITKEQFRKELQDPEYGAQQSTNRRAISADKNKDGIISAEELKSSEMLKEIHGAVSNLSSGQKLAILHDESLIENLIQKDFEQQSGKKFSPEAAKLLKESVITVAKSPTPTNTNAGANGIKAAKGRVLSKGDAEENEPDQVAKKPETLLDLIIAFIKEIFPGLNPEQRAHTEVAAKSQAAGSGTINTAAVQQTVENVTGKPIAEVLDQETQRKATEAARSLNNGGTRMADSRQDNSPQVQHISVSQPTPAMGSVRS